MVIAGEVLTILQRNQEPGPNGQYFVSIPIRVIGIVNRQRVRSATANVAMKIFLAVCMSGYGINKDKVMMAITDTYFLTFAACHC